MAVWRHRIARDEDGKLHFVFARYRPEEPRQRCGMVPMMNIGSSVEEMRKLVMELETACDDPVINMTEQELEPCDDDEDDYEDDE